MNITEIIDACKSKNFYKLKELLIVNSKKDSNTFFSKPFFEREDELRWSWFAQAFIETHCPDEQFKNLNGTSIWDGRSNSNKERQE